MIAWIRSGLVLAAAVCGGAVWAGQLTVETLAGPAGAIGSNDGNGGGARFNQPRGIAVDNNGNNYLTDTANHLIRKVDTSGNVTTLVGQVGISGAVNGIGAAAQFNAPNGIAIDSAGNFFVADSGNHVIRKINPAGLVTTFAGLPGSSGSADGTGKAARFNHPQGIAIDATDTVYVTDTLNQIIRKITPSGAVTTIAGTLGVAGIQDGPAAAAKFNMPYGVVLDGSGVIYIADSQNHVIRTLSPAGVVATFAGQAGMPGFADGIGTAAMFNTPSGLTIDVAGQILFIADTQNHSIRAADLPSMQVYTDFGNTPPNPSPQPGSADGFLGQFNAPIGLAFYPPSNSVTVADTGNHLIRSASFGDGPQVNTLAGQVGAMGYQDNSPPIFARFNLPSGVAIDPSNNVFVCDTQNHVIRSISPSGVTTLVGQPGNPGTATGLSGQFNGPTGISTLNTTTFVADTNNHAIRFFGATGSITDLAGTPGTPGSKDGPTASAQFNFPKGVYADPSGSVTYVADSGNHTIRAISAKVSTYAGLAGAKGSLDGPGAIARFNNPTAIIGDGLGALYIADTDNHTIRKIDNLGNVTTLAGAALNPGSADGFGLAARFNHPSGLVVAGNILYIADTDNQTIRAMDLTTLAVTTVAGNVAVAGGRDGTGTAAQFNRPIGIAADAVGNVYIADSLNSNIRHGQPVLTDTATIDQSVAPILAVRQLGVANQSTGVVYSWSIIRQPAGSTATLSDPTIANPTFVPDIADTYVFQLNTDIFSGSGAGAIPAGPAKLAATSIGASITTVTLTALPPAPTITSPSSASATVGVPFTYTITATDNAVTFGALNLPSGLSVDPVNGVISGTPKLAGLADVTLQATNPGGTGNGPLALTVNPTAPVITSPLSDSVHQGSPYSYTLTAINSPTTLSATGLPVGLTFDPSTGMITGRPSAQAALGTYNVVLTASNSAGSDQKTLMLTVTANTGPVNLQLTTQDNPGFPGLPVTYTFSASDADTPVILYTFSFGEGPPVTASFAQGSVVSLSHTYTGSGDFTVSLSVTDGVTTVTQSATETIPAPASGANGIPNISNQTDTVINPLNGFTIMVTNSDGGIIQLGITIDALIRDNFAVNTSWGDIAGRSNNVPGLHPVHQFVHHGIYVATSTATDTTVGAIAGKGRKMLAISTHETGEPTPTTQLPGAKSEGVPRDLGLPPSSAISTVSMMGKFTFSGIKKDMVSYTGTIQLPAGLNIFIPHEFDIGIGNIVVSTSVDKHGKGKAPGTPPILKTLAIKYPPIKRGALTKGGEIARVSVTFNTAGMVNAGFDTEGISDTSREAASGTAVPRTIQVAMVLDGVSYETLAPVNFTVSKTDSFGNISGRSRP